MAKKEKIQLTPEEIEAKKIRRSDGWTRFWAIVVALALTAGVFTFARSQGIKASEGTEVETSENADNGNSNSNNSSNTNSNTNNNSSSSTDSNTNSNTNNNSSSSSDNNSSTPANNGGGSGETANDAASVAELINKATAAAVNAKAGYDWERHGEVNNIDVGNATDTLNGIIKGVDENADLNSVVGGFLGRGDKKETVPKGMTLDTIDVPKDDGSTEKVYHGSSYTLKATNLQSGDIQNLQVNGDTYEFDLPDSSNPDRSGNTPLSRFCNDIVVASEVDAEIKEQVSVVDVNSLDANYKNIHVKAVITDGQLKELTYSYTADAVLKLKALKVVSVNGTGDLVANAKYSNFVY